jgi:predicted dehydrogenase
MKIAIFGSGFGLYGYLPAVLHLPGAEVMLPQAYRARLHGRSDIAPLADRILWKPDEAAMLDKADAVIVAQRPQDQPVRVNACLKRTNVRRLLLEKPLAPAPKDAMKLLDRVAQTGRVLRTGCTFRYTPWGRSLLACARHAGARSGPSHVIWSFRAHHYARDLQSWKRKVSAGGGALRFYGIHLIALLSELGYTQVHRSEILAHQPDEAEAWRAEFAGAGLVPCSVRLDSNADAELFEVQTESVSVRLHNPFEAPITDKRYDYRFGVLVDLCRAFLYDEQVSCEWHHSWLALWNAAEAASITRSPG